MWLYYHLLVGLTACSYVTVWECKEFKCLFLQPAWRLTSDLISAVY